MKSMYERRFSELKNEYKKVEGTKEKIHFLINERRAFKTGNTVKEAEIIIQWFNDEIELLKYFPEKVLQTDQKSTETKQTLSVPDWCIVFYYLDEAGKKQGAKIDRMITFITDNNIRNSNGKLTTKGSFKKQYYEIFHRINGTENTKVKKLPPLPPERIKNILHFLKKNKKALQTAKNDIVHLLNEIEENKKNDY